MSNNTSLCCRCFVTFMNFLGQLRTTVDHRRIAFPGKRKQICKSEMLVSNPAP